MWKPRVKAICSRAASRFDADAANGSGSSQGMSASLLSATGAAVAPDQGVGRAVVAELRLLLGLELGNDRHGQGLAQLDPPLVEGVDAPDRPLDEDAVLVERDQRAERVRVEPLGENRVRGPVALHHPVRTTASGVPSSRTCSGVLPK